MRLHTKTALIILITLGISCCASDTPPKKSDRNRVQDIHLIASLIEEYKDALGKYPFAENWENVEEGMAAVPILVHMSNYELPEEFQYPPPGTSGIVLSVEEFENYLSKGLRRQVNLPRDDRPIKTPRGNWPYFYQFQFDGHNYFVACYVNTEMPYTRKLGEGFYKYEVGSIDIPSRKTRRFRDIK